MDYVDLPKEIKAQLAMLVEKHSRNLVYGYFALDEQLLDWLRLALDLTEASELVELNYLAPCLMLFTCGAAGGNPQNFLEIGAAIQFMHKASAILDDIQDQDTDTSLACKLGSGQALNLALILINLGQITLFEHLEKLQEVRGNRNSFSLASKLLQSIATGLRGQLLDLQDQQVPLEERLQQPEAYLKKIALKTALTSSYLTELGATLGGANTQTIEVYKRFGFAFGLALHLLDDLQDFLRGITQSGRSCDLSNGYLSLALIYAFEELVPSQDFSWLKANLGQTQENQVLLQTLFQSKAAFLQTLAQAMYYVAQAEQELRILDNELKKVEHKLLTEKLKNFARNLYALYTKAHLLTD